MYVGVQPYLASATRHKVETARPDQFPEHGYFGFLTRGLAWGVTRQISGVRTPDILLARRPCNVKFV